MTQEAELSASALGWGWGWGWAVDLFSFKTAKGARPPSENQLTLFLSSAALLPVRARKTHVTDDLGAKDPPWGHVGLGSRPLALCSTPHPSRSAGEVGGGGCGVPSRLGGGPQGDRPCSGGRAPP